MHRTNSSIKLRHERMPKTCYCHIKPDPDRILKENIKDTIGAQIEIMTICGISNYRAIEGKSVLIKAFTKFDEVCYKVNRAPRKRLCKSDLIYDLSRKCKFSRKEIQLTYSITRRMFRAFYYGSTNCGLRNLRAEMKLTHSQECFWVHAAKRIAQIYATFEGMFFSMQKNFEERIKCVLRHLYDRILERSVIVMDREYYCSKCSTIHYAKTEKIKRSLINRFGLKSSETELSGDSAIFYDEISDLHCGCPKLVCAYLFDMEMETKNNVKDPFICQWSPMDKDEDEPFDKINIERTESVSEECECVCENDNDNLEEMESKSGESFYDDFDKQTLSTHLSEFECQVEKRCPNQNVDGENVGDEIGGDQIGEGQNKSFDNINAEHHNIKKLLNDNNLMNQQKLTNESFRNLVTFEGSNDMGTKGRRDDTNRSLTSDEGEQIVNKIDYKNSKHPVKDFNKVKAITKVLEFNKDIDKYKNSAIRLHGSKRRASITDGKLLRMKVSLKSMETLPNLVGHKTKGNKKLARLKNRIGTGAGVGVGKKLFPKPFEEKKRKLPCCKCKKSKVKKCPKCQED